RDALPARPRCPATALIDRPRILCVPHRVAPSPIPEVGKLSGVGTRLNLPESIAPVPARISMEVTLTSDDCKRRRTGPGVGADDGLDALSRYGRRRHAQRLRFIWRSTN